MLRLMIIEKKDVNILLVRLLLLKHNINKEITGFKLQTPTVSFHPLNKM